MRPGGLYAGQERGVKRRRYRNVLFYKFIHNHIRAPFLKMFIQVLKFHQILRNKYFFTVSQYVPCYWFKDLNGTVVKCESGIVIFPRRVASYFTELMPLIFFYFPALRRRTEEELGDAARLCKNFEIIIFWEYMRQ